MHRVKGAGLWLGCGKRQRHALGSQGCQSRRQLWPPTCNFLFKNHFPDTFFFSKVKEKNVA
jgi:hypothetical protein